MTRAAFLVAVMALAPTLPEGCAKALKKGKAPAASASTEPSPTVVPVPVASAEPIPTTTATAPPIWAPPEAPPEPAAPSEPANPDVAKARALAEGGDHKKVRALLEKKVKAGKGSDEEATLLMESCVALRDKACVESVKAKHPSVEGN